VSSINMWQAVICCLYTSGIYSLVASYPNPFNRLQLVDESNSEPSDFNAIRSIWNPVIYRRVYLNPLQDSKEFVADDISSSDDLSSLRSLLDKRARAFIGKRPKPLFVIKSARSFIGKRDNSELEDVDDTDGPYDVNEAHLSEKRGRHFIGKRSTAGFLRRLDAFPFYQHIDQDMDKRRSFIGKREEFDDRSQYLVDDLEEEKRRSFIGKRNDLQNEEEKRRSFIGKRENEEKEEEKRRSFIGKRDGMLMKDKRRSFIGKREDEDVDGLALSSLDVDKRRSFIGKRYENDDEKRRSFIGKRNEKEEEKRRSFIGKRNEKEEEKRRSFIGKRTEEEEKRRSFIGKRLQEEEKRRSFIGKRFENEEEKRRSFIGKREENFGISGSSDGTLVPNHTHLQFIADNVPLSADKDTSDKEKRRSFIGKRSQ